MCSVECRHILRKREGEKSRAYTQARREFAKWAKKLYFKNHSRLQLLRRWRARAETLCQCGHPIGWAKTKTVPAKDCAACTAAKALETKKAYRKKRKVAKRAATVETVHPLRVFMRDGWRCYLCGGMTDPTKRGSLHPNAPEVEHIIPIAKGGEHSYANTACAHKKCNAAKSDKIEWKPLLLAA